MECRVCDSTDLELAVDLGLQPWCNHFLRPEEIGQEPTYPLRLVCCQACGTAQLDYTVKKEIMFGDHTYLSGVTRSLRDHFHKVATEINQRFFTEEPTKSVLDIGSNDGTQLLEYQQLGFDVLGVEPSKRTAQIALEAGVPTVNEFFNLQLAKSLGRKFDVVSAAGVFFHLEELHSVAEGIRECLATEGIFAVQFLYMKNIVDNLAFDQIYHEHLLYYTLNTLQRLLDRHGLAMFDAYLAPIHGGSMIAYVTHAGQRTPSERLRRLLNEEQASRINEFATYRAFADRILRMKQENIAYLQLLKAAGKKIFGFGAPVKGNTLLNYFGIGKQYLDCVVEKNALRRGLYTPGTHLPVIMEDEIAQPPDVYYVLAWNFKDEIMSRNQHLLKRGVEFYFPVNPKAVAA